MKYLLLTFFPLLLFAQASFITPMEYAARLYKNPRGIGCQHCHGAHGEGKLIALYRDKKEDKVFRGPPINNLEYLKFYEELNKRKKGMPRYFLTQKEIQALYLFVTKENNTTQEKVNK